MWTQKVKVCPTTHRAGITDTDKVNRFSRIQYFSQGHTAARKCHNDSLHFFFNCSFTHWEIVFSKIIESQVSFLKSHQKLNTPFLSGVPKSLWHREKKLDIQSSLRTSDMRFLNTTFYIYCSFIVFRKTGLGIHFAGHTCLYIPFMPIKILLHLNFSKTPLFPSVLQ